MQNALLALLLILGTFTATAQLHVEYAPRSLHISGASHLGDVVVVGTTHSRYLGNELISGHQSINRADVGGSLTVTVEHLSFQSVWLIVDLRSGEFGTFSPPGYEPSQIPVPPDAIDHFGRSILQVRRSASVFLVRKGVGAWRARAGEDSATDDPAAARLPVNSKRLKSIGATPAAPEVFVPGDILMVFDAPYMKFWITKLTPADLQGGQ
jgi:hypothetical protein